MSMSEASDTITRGGPTHYRSRSSDSFTGALPPDPTEVVLTRSAGWLSLIRLLILQFEDQTNLEKHLAESQKKTLKHWTSNPSRERDHAFSTSSGINTLMECLRETCAQVGMEHEAVYKALHTQIVPSLKAMERDVHKKMETMMRENESRRKEKAKDENAQRKLLKQLQRALTASKGVGDVAPWEAGDPWLINLKVRHHLNGAIRKFDTHTTTLTELERTYGAWEKNLIKNLKSALLAYTSLQSVAAASHGATQNLATAVQNLDPDTEWKAYRDTKLANTAANPTFQSDYPGSNDEFTQLVREGPMRRKSKVLHHWHEKWYCLTAGGWLHEFAARPKLEVADDIKPKRSVWLRSCTLTPFGGSVGVTEEEFHLTEVRVHHPIFTKKRRVYKFSTNSMSESQAWYEALSQFVPTPTGTPTNTLSRKPSLASTASSVSRHEEPRASLSSVEEAGKPVIATATPVAVAEQQSTQQPTVHTEQQAMAVPSPSNVPQQHAQQLQTEKPAVHAPSPVSVSQQQPVSTVTDVKGKKPMEPITGMQPDPTAAHHAAGTAAAAEPAIGNQHRQPVVTDGGKVLGL